MYCPSAVQLDPGGTLPVSVLLGATPLGGPDREGLAPLGGPAAADSELPESEEAEPADAEPADAEPADAEPADDEPADDESADAEPADAEPADAEPADDEPADDEPADAEPADAGPADAELPNSSGSGEPPALPWVELDDGLEPEGSETSCSSSDKSPAALELWEIDPLTCLELISVLLTRTLSLERLES